MLKEYYEKYKQFLLPAAVGAAVILIILLAVNIFSAGNGKVSITENHISGEELAGDVPEVEEVIEAVPDYVFVEVKGAVKNPGVFEVPADARVTNVLSLAEVLASADLLTVNQSEKVKDEMVIYVPKEGEVEDASTLMEPGGTEGETEILININTAAAEELTALNGIGEKKAQLIVEYREQNGLFMTKEDLMNISGIGEKTFDSLEPYITIE